MTDEVETLDLVFDIPDRKTPGYLKRAKEALQFKREMEGDMTPETVDRLVEYLAQYVSVPEEPEAKREAMWMASEEQFKQLLDAILGVTDPNTPAPAS